MYYLIYKITNNVNNKIYIGKHQTEDKNDDYMGSGKILKRAIEKYGLDKFTKEILFECNSLEEMNEKEAKIVDEEFIARLDTYNVKLGGQGGWDYVNQKGLNTSAIFSFTKEEMSINGKKGRNKLNNLLDNEDFKKEYHQKISNGLKLYYKKHNTPFFGKKHTDESKAKIGKANSIKQKGKLNSNYGKCWIYNEDLKENKSIKKDEIQSWLEQGWKKGRKMKFFKKDIDN